MGTEAATAKTSSPDDTTSHIWVSTLPGLHSSECEQKVGPAASAQQNPLFPTLSVLLV